MSDRPELMPARMAFARIWVLLLAAVDGLYGAGLLVRRSDDARYLLVLKQWPISVTVYAVALIAVGALLLARRLRAAGIIGAGVWFTFAAASVVLITPGIPPTPDGAIAALGFGAFHWLVTYGASRGLPARTR